MASAVRFQPERQPEYHFKPPDLDVCNDLDGIQILALRFDLLPVHRMDVGPIVSLLQG